MSLARLQALGADWETQARMLEAARQRVVEQLASARWAAIGFAGANSAERPQDQSRDRLRLAVLPPALWGDASGIDWSASSLTAAGAWFADVRVLDRERLIAGAGPAPGLGPSPAEAARLGRPVTQG